MRIRAKRLNPIVIVIAFVLLIPIPVFAQEAWFYDNEMFEFSFDILQDWSIVEEFWIGDKVYPVIVYPDEFSVESLKDSEEYASEIFPDLPFVISAPNITVQFDIVTEEKIPILDENTVKDYALERVKLSVPFAEIPNLDVESYSWGWIVRIESVFTLDTGVDQLPYHSINTTYFFNDRESYDVGFSSLEENFEVYSPMYENLLDTLIIKGVIVPEFGGIALLILTSSIVSVIIVGRKFRF